MVLSQRIHTPANKGAQQPGMTGQVKEDIISRFGELGVTIEKGILGFIPNMLRREEFIESEDQFHYYDVNQEKKSILLPPNSLCFSFCQVPIVYHISTIEYIEIKKKDHNTTRQNSGQLDFEIKMRPFTLLILLTIITVSILSYSNSVMRNKQNLNK